MSSFEPMFLIAVPQMGDPNFAKSVVLVLQHDEEGTLGLIVNSPTNILLGRFAESQGLTCHEGLEKLAVFRGGPVDEERGWILHADESVEEKQVIQPGLFVSGTSETLKSMITKGARPFRLILGYAGWGAGQLEEEMVQGAWITAKVHPKYVFEIDPVHTWKTILTDMGVDPNRLMVGTGLH